ncbi:hypothetical protein E8E14_009788 [Neopestalotiopsis sp. 37M]|nr:hypothetical protein E8E14_009788 [Neopestalotiopsis sp. 37M]
MARAARQGERAAGSWTCLAAAPAWEDPVKELAVAVKPVIRSDPGAVVDRVAADIVPQ